MKRLVASARNSICGSASIADLDFSEWWTDWGFSGEEQYLKAWRREDDTVHRVHCRFSDRPRLLFEGGKLYWLLSKDEAR